MIGSPFAFVSTCSTTLLWLALGAWIGWTEYWQITYTTVLTITTQLTAQLIQNTQNRQEQAMQLKLDELIRAVDSADNRLRGIERIPGGEDRDEMGL